MDWFVLLIPFQHTGTSYHYSMHKGVTFFYIKNCQKLVDFSFESYKNSVRDTRTPQAREIFLTP